VINISQQFQEWLVQTRRDFHMHPETAYEEMRTTDRIAIELTEMGLEVRRFEDMTGVVGLLRGGKDGRTVALRADIDALKLQELTDVPYKSRYDGRMHACGHDAHATIMLGVAKHLMESGLGKTLPGNVKFFFQPAEEGGAGAKRMIDRGVLENPEVDVVMAGHVLPDMELGHIGVFEGQSHASADRFELTITGLGGHGGRPHQVRDPIIAAAHWITAVQAAAARSVDPVDSAVITVGSIHGGNASNVVPREVVLHGTTRAIGDGVQARIRERMLGISRGVEAAFEVQCELEFDDGYPPVINDSGISRLLHDTAIDIFGPGKAEYMRPSTGGEDFAYFAQQKPSAIIRLGCRVPGRDFSPLHSPYFDMDERVLGLGVELFTAAVQRYFAS
jgi:amidohydrolase